MPRETVLRQVQTAGVKLKSRQTNRRIAMYPHASVLFEEWIVQLGRPNSASCAKA